MKTAIIILSYFSNHLTFQTEFKVSPRKYYEKYNIVVGLLHSPHGFPWLHQRNQTQSTLGTDWFKPYITLLWLNNRWSYNASWEGGAEARPNAICSLMSRSLSRWSLDLLKGTVVKIRYDATLYNIFFFFFSHSPWLLYKGHCVYHVRSIVTICSQFNSPFIRSSFRYSSISFSLLMSLMT